MTLTLAIDIGGTKISAGIVTSDYQITHKTTVQSGRGIKRLKDTLDRCIHWAMPHLPQSIAIGTPGKLIGTPKKIAPGTAQNMAAFPGEFDHLCIQDLISVPHANFKDIFIINDALAQLCGGIVTLKLTAPMIVGYIGPGTGLGGGFATIQDNNPLQFETDGHIFDIMIPRDPQDIWSTPGDWVMSEDVISGRGFYDITGISVLDWATKKPAHATPVIDLFGRYMTQLIRTLKAGSFEKKNAADNWTKREKEIASKTSHWIIGGSVGKLLFPTIKTALSSEIKSNNLRQIPSPADAALIGVVYARDMA